MDNNAKEKLSQAIIGFYNTHPLYYFLLTPLKRIENKQIFSMGVGFEKEKGVSSVTLFYNPDTINRYPLQTVRTILHHEILHVALKHLVRRGERDKTIANVAMDVMVNYWNPTFKEDILSMGADGQTEYDARATHEKFKSLKNCNIRDMTFEEIYDKIKDDPKTKEFQNTHQMWQLGSGDGQEQGTPLTPQEEAALNAALQNAVEQMVTSGKQAGNVPGELQRTIEQLKMVKTNWKKIINIFAQNVALEEKESTWKKKNRRCGFTAPGERSEYKPKLLVVVDNSGSTYHIYDTFMSHICKISKFQNVTCIGVDQQVNFEFVFKNGKIPSEFKDAHSGGGTLFQPAFDFAKERRFDGIIYLTDGYNFDEKTLNTYHVPVLFAIGKDQCKPIEGYRNIVIQEE